MATTAEIIEAEIKHLEDGTTIAEALRESEREIEDAADEAKRAAQSLEHPWGDLIGNVRQALDALEIASEAWEPSSDLDDALVRVTEEARELRTRADEIEDGVKNVQEQLSKALEPKVDNDETVALLIKLWVAYREHQGICPECRFEEPLPIRHAFDCRLARLVRPT